MCYLVYKGKVYSKEQYAILKAELRRAKGSSSLCGNNSPRSRRDNDPDALIKQSSCSTSASDVAVCGSYSKSRRATVTFSSCGLTTKRSERQQMVQKTSPSNPSPVSMEQSYVVPGRG